MSSPCLVNDTDFEFPNVVALVGPIELFLRLLSLDLSSPICYGQRTACQFPMFFQYVFELLLPQCQTAAFYKWFLIEPVSVEWILFYNLSRFLVPSFPHLFLLFSLIPNGLIPFYLLCDRSIRFRLITISNCFCINDNLKVLIW